MPAPQTGTAVSTYLTLFAVESNSYLAD